MQKPHIAIVMIWIFHSVTLQYKYVFLQPYLITFFWQHCCRMLICVLIHCLYIMFIVLLQVWKKASVFLLHGVADNHHVDPGCFCQLGHVLYPQLSEGSRPDIKLHLIPCSG